MDVFFAACGIALGVGLFLAGFYYYKVRRLVENIPTSKIRSMAIGLVETKGKAVDRDAMLAPLTQAKCVYYAYEVEEWVKSGKNHTWKTLLKKDTENIPFYIRDETGEAQVVPHGANFSLKTKLKREVNSRSMPANLSAFLGQNGIDAGGGLFNNRRFKFTEYNIVPGQNVYVIGVCRDNRAFLEQHRRLSLAEAVKAAKNDPIRMKGFDLNNDGDVSSAEWDQALSQISKDVETQPESSDDKEVFIGCGTGGRDEVFHISECEKSFKSECLFYAVGGIMGGSGISVGSLWYLVSHFGLQ